MFDRLHPASGHVAWALTLVVGIACGDDSAVMDTEGESSGGSSTTSPPLGECRSFRAHCLGVDDDGPGVSTTGPGTADATVTLDGAESSSGGQEETTGPDVPADCDNLEPLPVTYTIVSGPSASEDFVFDALGNLVNVADGGNLLRAPYAMPSQLWFPGVGVSAAGTAMLSNGDVVFNDAGANQVIHVDQMGSTTVIAAGVSYPNGLTVDMNDQVYVSENSGERVLRIDPFTLEVVTVSIGLFSPNGLGFDKTYENLYIGSFGGGTVHRLNIETGVTELFASGIGGGGLDGVVVDECDNVYVTDFGPGTIYRLTQDGQIQFVVDLGGETSWIPNLHFGSGIGGWDDSLLYVMDRGQNRTFVLDLGVKGIPLPHLP